ncbi:MAG: cobyric acid synthase [Hyphomicrobiaceae bacterium]
MGARAIMLQGTGSDVGKSLLVAGLARAYADQGLKVRPFKPQNMSNNAAVTADGGEIGRAQALQARAARTPLSVHMNPVLLKPQSEIGSQVIVQGRIAGTAKAKEFQGWKPRLMGAVLDSFGRLAGEADLVLVEGAGSAAEVNLRAGDIANMGFARRAGVPVVLVGDIDRGGVIASLVGTYHVVQPEDRAMIGGFLVNKFRGDPALFAEGMTMIERATGWPGLGLVPWFGGAHRLPAEDAVALGRRTGGVAGGGRVVIAALVLPSISNFDDLDPLKLEPGVDLRLVRTGEAIPAEARLVILPGSKATIADLAALRAERWHVDLEAHVRRGGHVLGLCGGFQMLGRSIADPEGIEGPAGRVEGLGLLDVETELTGEKVLVEVSGRSAGDGTPFKGYEMHVGRTGGAGLERPLLMLEGERREGAVSPSGRVAGCYIHGLFADDRQRARWLERIGAASSGLDYEGDVEATLDALARHVAAHVDLDRLLAIAAAPAAEALTSAP